MQGARSLPASLAGMRLCRGTPPATRTTRRNSHCRGPLRGARHSYFLDRTKKGFPPLGFFAPPNPGVRLRPFSSATPRESPVPAEAAAATTTTAAPSSRIATEAAAASGSGDPESSSSSSYFGALLRRLACSLGIVYAVTEYGIEWTVCEGPSMLPTIRPCGEIVLMDRLTPRLWGLSNGDSARGRTEACRAAQEKHERDLRRERLLRYHREREEEKGENTNTNTKTGAGSPKQGDTRTESKPAGPTNPAHGSDGAAIGSSKSDSPPGGPPSGGDAAPCVWYEPRIPVDKLPPEGAWDRFRERLSTGITVGDVVVLQHPDRIGTVCKRVVGLPGDVIAKPSSRLGAEKLLDALHGGASAGPAGETVAQRRRRIRRAVRRAGGTEVPDGHVWVEGDNPWNSNDSRNYGAVPAALITGRVVCRLWPLRGNAMLERGPRPSGEGNDDGSRPSLAFSGSIAIPAGWDGQRIVREPPERASQP